MSKVRWEHSLPSALALMVPFDFMAALGMDVYLPVVPIMPDVLSTDATLIQFSLTFYLLVLGCGQLLFGPLSDHIGRRPVLFGSALIFSGSSAALACTRSGDLFLLFRILQAFGASGALVATFATVRDVYAGRREIGVVYGMFSACLAFVPAFGPILGAAIEHWFGWTGIFWFLAGASAAALINAIFRWPETRKIDNNSFSFLVLKSIFTNKLFWIYTIGSSVAMGDFFVFFSISPRILMSKGGLTSFEFSLAFASVAVVLAITAKLGSRFATAWGPRGCLIRGMSLSIMGACLMAGAQIGLLPLVAGIILPMWIIASGVAITISVAVNAALTPFDGMSGTATAAQACTESCLMTVGGTLVVFLFPINTCWPLVFFGGFFGVLTIALASMGLQKQS
ncbi:chloramphenicol efflux MFS transporter [Komagataeibacter xylinus]|nr:chloramphenicol efflux MFS transporter [Komagataeibacter xylinus]RFP07408.1 chloramphenicol efflux MFS transporter [Komagataeibacter xylinus]